MNRLRDRRVLMAVGLVAVLALTLVLPAISPDSATTNMAVFTLMYVGLATAWNIMGGYTGYISLGHAGFFGFGAYALGLLLAKLSIAGGYAPFLFVPVAGLLTGLMAAGVGWFALRTRAATFVIVTIAFMFMLQLLAENLTSLTGGGAGLGLPNPPWRGDFFNIPFYYAMLALAVVGLAVSWSIRRSKFGLGLLAIRDDEDKALAVGVPARAFKLTAFVMMVFLGGLGTLWGPVLGAVILEPAQLWLAYNYGASRLYLVLYSAVFLLVILLMPRGIIPSVRDLIAERRASAPAARAGAAP